ncbi:trp operon repressor [Brucepastera parasyntrophica]|uniref:Trp family transcriptional regulator n=1 Tax=Brucepastera parasyntrophica TaxID=2880008 RepID=UPI002109A39A|nr:Trp family transcriptional regulator [Brucepastera parasyntrophica]ULQ59518.1 trp operon repressor [Brucepastera parasyntrophica]
MEEDTRKEEMDIIINDSFKELSYALSKASDPELIGEFLEELFTPTELKEMALRWALVRELEDGVTQREIARKLGLSLCKITRGSRELKKENSAFRQMIRLSKT